MPTACFFRENEEQIPTSLFGFMYISVLEPFAFLVVELGAASLIYLG